MEKKNEKEKYKSSSFLNSLNEITIDITSLSDILPENSNHGLCGSKNLGNTCYMNSSIACLSNCTELTTFFLSKEFRKYINSSNKNGLKGKLANAWYELLKEYWKTTKLTGNPREIQTLIGKKYKKFDSDDQQDANEFIVLFLELLGEDLNEIKNKKYLELKEQQHQETDEECAKRFWDLHLSRNNSIITNLFCGLNKSIIKCPLCKYKSITYNPFTSISLLIPNNKQLKTVKYLNYSKEDIFLYYIPRLCLGKTYKIYIRVEKGISFKEILSQIQKVDDFPYEISKVDIISVINKELNNIIKADQIYDEINKNKNTFYFAIEKDFLKNKEMIFIPIYIKLGDKYSAYPRGLYVFPGMSYKLFQKKMYFLARKYIYHLSSNIKNFEVDKKITNIIFDYNKDEEQILLELIEKEYKVLLKHNYDETIIFPYNLLIQKNIYSEISTIFFDGKEDFFENLNKYQITTKESPIDLLIKDLQNLNNILIINININSKYFRKSIAKGIDVCNSITSDDYCKNDYIKEANITLEDCFQLFNLEENLDVGNEWFCKICKNHVKAKKKLEFFYLPKIMCICLSRFKKIGDEYTKNEKFVDFPLENLNMNKFMAFNDGKKYIYDIFAVNEHYGGREGGHYTAICKNYDGNWYSYDDSNCSISSKRDICTRNAYILFYRRRDW